MKALTLLNPWAGLIAYRGKRVENRTWKPPQAIIGQRIAIHAGKGMDKNAAEWLAEVVPDLEPLTPTESAASAILCTAIVDSVVEASTDHWFNGPYGWKLRDVETFAPIPCKGALGLWTVPHEIEVQIQNADTVPAKYERIRAIIDRALKERQAAKIQ